MTIQMPLGTALRMQATATAAARVAPLSDGRAAIFFDLDAAAVPRGARISARYDSRPFDGPMAVTRLGCDDGRERHVLIAARPAAELCRASIRIEAGERTVAVIDPSALQSPLVDPLALITGLDETGGRRLLRLLLTTGASLFGKGDLGAFGTIVGRLIEGQTAAVPLASLCRVGRGAAVLSWRIDRERLPVSRGDLCILAAGKALRFTGFEAVEERHGDQTILHLLIARRLPEGADLIVLGDRPVRLSGHGDTVVRDLTDWLERRPSDVRANVLSWLDRLAGGEAEVAALSDELACPPGQAPRIEALHLSEAPDGLLYVVAVDDPRGLLSAVRITAAGSAAEIPCQRLEPLAGRGNVVAGFVPMPGRCGGLVGLAPIFGSGRTGAGITAAATPFEGGVPEIFEALPPGPAAAALARAIPSAMRGRPVWRRRVTEFGPQPTSPATAIIAAAGAAPEHLHALMAALAGETASRALEVVIHHPGGPATQMVLKTAEKLSAVHRMGIRVVAIAEPALPSECLRAALAETRASRCIAFAPDCLPEGRGWLSGWRRRLAAVAHPRAIAVVPRDWDGTIASGYAVGLNAAAIARLLGTRPSLPSVLADIAATDGIGHARARGLRVISFAQSPPTDLLLAAEAAALTHMREAPDV